MSRWYFSVTEIIIRQLGLQEYYPTWHAMQTLTENRTNDQADEIWLVQHPPVFTLGRSAKEDHILDPGTIPVIRIDRGGEVTYHGPGQLIVYVMLDIKRLQLGIRPLVTLLENSVISVLSGYAIAASAKREAPGVYVHDRKIASLGLRIRKGCSFHGLSLNIDMDLNPFRRIHPCGHRDLEVTQMRELTADANINKIGMEISNYLTHTLEYDTLHVAGNADNEQALLRYRQ
ncbi:MAG: lipoyl(octanoyl) transferase LipB [Gammaproteobacteria bacterium]